MGYTVECGFRDSALLIAKVGMFFDANHTNLRETTLTLVVRIV